LLVISDLCEGVAEKILLGLRMGAIRSQFARNRAAMAAEAGPSAGFAVDP